MGDRTGIEWTDASWNIVTGCDRVSPGCDHCYAATMARRLKAMGNPRYQTDGDPRTSGPGFGVQTHPDLLEKPLRWRKPRRVFVNSMSDLFHPKVPLWFIERVWDVMAATPQHTYQILTKRPKRMRIVVPGIYRRYPGPQLHDLRRGDPGYGFGDVPTGQLHSLDMPNPLPNVWLGTSVEDQQRADERIPPLLDTPAAVRFLSMEPLLGPVDLEPWLDCTHESASGGLAHDGAAWTCDGCGARWRDVADPDGPCWSSRIGPFRKDYEAHTGLDWIIVGGESGPGARPMHPQWARDLRDQAVAVGVPFFFKQWGAWRPLEGNQCAQVGDQFYPGTTDGPMARNVGKHAAGRVLDGRTWDQFPDTQEVPS